MDIPALIHGNALLLGALAVVMIVLVNYQKGLTYREAVVTEFAKARVFSALETVLPVTLPRIGRIPSPSQLDRPLTREAHADDFVGTIDATPREIVSTVRPPFQPNLTSTAKYRVLDGQTVWAHSQWAEIYRQDGQDWQTHLILFPAGNATDVYVHVEAPPTDPERHTEGEQLLGDAHGRFSEAWN
jgi:hypothetical protein